MVGERVGCESVGLSRITLSGSIALFDSVTLFDCNALGEKLAEAFEAANETKRYQGRQQVLRASGQEVNERRMTRVLRELNDKMSLRQSLTKCEVRIVRCVPLETETSEIYMQDVIVDLWT